MHDVKSDVCITAVSLDTGKARFHKSDYKLLYKERLDEKLVDIALATSAAPTYFPAHNMKHSIRLIDGGVCANNPSMIALVEPSNFQRSSKRGTAPSVNPRTDIALLSVGTGSQPNMPYDSSNLAGAGLYEWAQHIADVMFQSQSELIHEQVLFLLGAENYLRINPTLHLPIALDDASKIKSLDNLMSIESQDEKFLDTRFT